MTGLPVRPHEAPARHVLDVGQEKSAFRRTTRLASRHLHPARARFTGVTCVAPASR